MHLNLNENGAKFRTCAGRDVASLTCYFDHVTYHVIVLLKFGKSAN